MNENLTLKEVKKIVEDVCKVNISRVCRKEDYVIGRSIYYYCCRMFAKGESLEHIGNLVNLDHASVINGLKKLDDKIKGKTYHENNLRKCLTNCEIKLKINRDSESNIEYDGKIFTSDDLIDLLNEKNKIIEELNDKIFEMQKVKRKVSKHPDIEKQLDMLLPDEIEGFKQRLHPYILMCLKTREKALEVKSVYGVKNSIYQQ